MAATAKAKARPRRAGERGPLRLAEGDPVLVLGQPGEISADGREGIYWPEHKAYLVKFPTGARYYVGIGNGGVIERAEG